MISMMESLDADQWQSSFVDIDLDFPVLYKLTDSDDRTFGNTKWGENIIHRAAGQVVSKDDPTKVMNDKPSLCSSYWLHAYTNPVIAILVSPMHVDFVNPNLWVCTGKPKIMDADGKVGCTKLTTHYRMVCPIVSETTRICWAMRCLSKVYKEDAFNLWANNWVSGYEREYDVDQITYKYFTEKFSEEKIKRMRGVDNDYYEAWAAKYIAEATVQVRFSNNSRVSKLIRKNSAVAAVAAKRISMRINNPFDLIKVTEEVMAAKNDVS
jgi:hypothetical protein